jgi:phospholipid/cholesterol/gamma-HCH transport system substrate-binding protein
MRRLIQIVPAAALIVVLVLVLSAGSSPYRLLMRVGDADGLRNGSPVVIGGVSVGSVHLDAHERYVTIELNLSRKYAPVGRNVTAAIVSQNVLGQKQVSLTAGDTRRDPAGSGYLIPAAQTAASADLDQLLSTLDDRTRSRLAVLVNELGTAFYGRQLDFHQFITELVPALESGSNLLGQIASENTQLGDLLHNADAFVGSLAASRVQIADGLDALGQATQTIAGRQQSLRATLHAAPQALASTRAFLASLQATTGPLASTARLLSATAPSLRTALQRTTPFTAAATPALQAATSRTAPALSALAASGTPNAGALLPTLVNASALVRQQVPAVGDALNGSIDNLLALLDNWAHAIQFRDGISHIFRGEATIAPSEYTRLLANLGIARTSGSAPRAVHATSPAAPPTPSPAPSTPAAAPVHTTLPGVLGGAASRLNQTLGSLAQSLTGALNSSTAQSVTSKVKSLLGYLLKP